MKFGGPRFESYHGMHKEPKNCSFQVILLIYNLWSLFIYDDYELTDQKCARICSLKGAFTTIKKILKIYVLSYHNNMISNNIISAGNIAIDKFCIIFTKHIIFYKLMKELLSTYTTT